MRSNFIQEKIANFHVGIAILHFKKSDMDNLLIPVLDIYIQKKIGDITICHDSERIPFSGKDRESMIGGIPYYGATDIMGYVNRPIFDGDYVLLAEDGSVMDEDGHPILQKVTGQVWVNNHAHVLEPIKNHSCKLLMMFLKDVNVPMIKTGSIQMKINQENMNGITVPNIPEDIKDKINLELSTTERKQLQIIAENRERASLRDFLLPMISAY